MELVVPSNSQIWCFDRFRLFNRITWLACVPRGIVRTGTIPFMAMELLKNHYWEGNTTWHYYHELEALIWVLPFVFLAYDNGKFDPRTRFIEDWMTSNYDACRGDP